MMSSAHSAVLAVLHDLNLAGAYADRVMVMSEGEVVAVSRLGERVEVELEELAKSRKGESHECCEDKCHNPR